MRTVDPTVPAWAPLASVGLAATGLVLSAYLSIEHVTAPGTLACPAGPTVNCARVTTSDQASLLGVPVAFLGVVFFAAMVAVCVPAAWRSPSGALRRARTGLAAAGAAFVVYLIYAELFLVDAICLWCTAVHVVEVALFAVVAWAAVVRGPVAESCNGARHRELEALTTAVAGSRSSSATGGTAG